MAPTLLIGARDDGYGTSPRRAAPSGRRPPGGRRRRRLGGTHYAAAQYTASKIAGAKFVGFETGGHLLVGHDDAVRAEIVEWLLAAARP